MVRLQKFLAECGVASRRAGEELIRAGRVSVNGQIVRQLGTRVNPQHDRVCVDDSPVRLQRKHYVMLHKPRGYLCTRRDPGRRPTVGDLLPPEWRSLHPVGRLDLDSEGLLLLTNDGAFTLRLTHPRYGIRKVYHVVVEGRVEPQQLARLEHGVTHQGEHLTARRATLRSANNSTSQLEIELTEGRNREVRRMMEVLGRPVLRLHRTRIGPLKLGELPVGKWRTLTPAEVKSLMAPL
jgi:23S rRNA pseudouridine2605 synthase